jgi:hypothetical protein
MTSGETNQDVTLGQPVVLTAGLSRQGTEAAGTLVSDPIFLKSLFGKRHDAKTVNVEAVVQTHVVDGHPGVSQIVAVDYW